MKKYLLLGSLAGVIFSLIVLKTRLMYLAGYVIENAIFAGRYQNYGYISATQATQANYVWITVLVFIVVFGILGLLTGLISRKK